LSDKQVSDITEHLKPFAGQTFVITTYRNNAEGFSIAVQLFNALNGAGWKNQPATGMIVGVITGISVDTYAGASLQTVEAAKQLVEQLNAKELSATLTGNNSFPDRKGTIDLSVGIKP
jgi:hypothetical protein